jgi:prepilin-type N-terminal cleavage/methylation domain-containing protein
MLDANLFYMLHTDAVEGDRFVIMKNNRAFTLIEILLVVAIIGLIAAIGAPIFLNAIQNSQNHVKKDNITSVEAAKEQWAFENNKANGTSVLWSNISPYMGNSTTSLTNLDVNGSTITINNIGTPASY